MKERRADETRRKRASKACLACRRRKVRCDVAQRGAPCINCVLDKEDCIVKPRATKYLVGKKNNVSDAPRAHLKSSGNTSSDHSPNHTSNSPPTPRGSSSIQDILMGEGEDTRDRDLRNHSLGDNGRRMSRVSEKAPTTAGGSNEFTAYSSSNLFENPSEMDSEWRSTINTHIMFSYYPFLKPGSMSKIAPQDVNFLEAQGCFRVPTRSYLDEFIREYFLHIHPILPILNEQVFWKMYEDCDSNPHTILRISLFVFHAMLFASSSFVSSATVQKLGFTHNRSARAAYYRRAKLLFEFDSETDPFSMAQGTLLMSYFSPMHNSPKANTYWLGLAIHFAKQADAHRYQTKRNITNEQRNALKRLWWCCILRDRILPLGVRKSIQITSVDFDFHTQKPLVLEDFESEIQSSRVYNAITKRALTKRLVALCELAVALTDVLLLLYSEKEPFAQAGQSDPSSTVRACKFELITWFEKTTVKCLTSPATSDVHESVVLYTNLMYIYYHSAILALCNYEVLLATLGMSSANNSLAQIYNTRRQIEEAIKGVTENLKELVQLKLAKYMPISVVAYAALPLVLHLLDVKLSKTPSPTAKKQRRLKIYMTAMEALKLQYDVTDEVSDIIGQLVKHVSLEHQEVLGETPSTHSEADPGPLPSRLSDDPSIVNDWGDVLLRQPKLYLRLAITIDLSMSRGYPTDLDFPLALQSKSKSGAQFPHYHISMDGTNPPEYFNDGTSRARSFADGMDGPPREVANGPMTGFDRPMGLTPSEMMTPVGIEAMPFDPNAFELPMGFEAFDMELSSKRGFDFDFPWTNDDAPFPGPI